MDNLPGPFKIYSSQPYRTKTKFIEGRHNLLGIPDVRLDIYVDVTGIAGSSMKCQGVSTYNNIFNLV